MMIFNSFTVVNGYARRVSLPTNKTFEGICLALPVKLLQKELGIIFLYSVKQKLLIYSFKLIFEHIS